MHYILIFIGGGIGSICRYFISTFASQYIYHIFPLGTLPVNVIGSFFMGFFFYLFQNSTIPAEVRLLLTVGFLGGFTTFSAFSMETISLLKNGATSSAIFNIIITNTFCLSSTVAGVYLAKIAAKY